MNELARAQEEEYLTSENEGKELEGIKKADRLNKIKAITTSEYPLRHKARDRKGIIFYNIDLSLRGGKELAIYQEKDFYAEITCYQETGYILEVTEKRDHWRVIKHKLFDNLNKAKKEFIEQIKIKKGDVN